MKTVLIKNNLFLFTLCLTILCCKNRTEKFNQNTIYKISINEKELIDSLNISNKDKILKIILNKVYTKNKLTYELEVFSTQKLINTFNIPYHFISVNDTLQADDLRLRKDSSNLDHKKEKINNRFVVEFWQSQTLFQYLIYFNDDDFYLTSIKRKHTDLEEKSKNCLVILNENLKKISVSKIDSIINNFDNIKNCN